MKIEFKNGSAIKIIYNDENTRSKRAEPLVDVVSPHINLKWYSKILFKIIILMS